MVARWKTLRGSLASAESGVAILEVSFSRGFLARMGGAGASI